MALGFAGRMGPAHSRTGVNALVSNTGSVIRTLWVDGTLRFAFNIRISE